MSPDLATLTSSVAATVKELDPNKLDTAAVALALDYASAIDGAEDRAGVLNDLGPKLLAVLTALGATPAARAAALKGGTDHAAPAPAEDTLSALRARRRARTTG